MKKSRRKRVRDLRKNLPTARVPMPRALDQVRKIYPQERWGRSNSILAEYTDYVVSLTAAGKLYGQEAKEKAT